MRITSASVRAFASRFVIALVAGGFIVGAYIRAGDWYEHKKVAEIPRTHFDPRRNPLVAKSKDDPGKPGNFLIVGNDSRGFVQTQIDRQHFCANSTDCATGTRSDTIMIAHIDPAVKVASLVSIPRDTLVQIPGCNQTDKINATFNSDWTTACGRKGGPDLLIDTIKQNFDVPINHYLEVDFVAFRKIVDVIGHVSLYFPTPARDLKSGLFVETGGCQQLDGIQSLNYARSRYYQWRDYTTGGWHDDPRGDLGRIARQQYFIRTLMQSAVDVGARNFFKAKDMIDKIVPKLIVDDGFDTADLNRLVHSFRSLDPGHVAMYTIPTHGATEHGQSVEIVDPGAEQIFAMLRGFSKPVVLPSIKPSDVTVDVQNATGRNGVAATALYDLRAFGFTGGASTTSSSALATTEVRATHAHLLAAALVSRYLGGAGKVVEVSDTGTADVVVVLGRDFQRVATPTVTTTTAPHASTTVLPATTTTTLPPNPGVPPAGAHDIGHQLIGCR